MVKLSKALTAVFLLLIILLFSSCYNIPEGYQKLPHSREDALDYIKASLKTADVSLSEIFINTSDKYDYKVQKWSANFNGISFIVASKQDLVFDSTGEFSKKMYVLTNDYNYTIVSKLFDSIKGEIPKIKMQERNESYEYRDDIYFDVSFLSRADINEALTQSNKLQDLIMKDNSDIPLHFQFITENYLIKYSTPRNEDGIDNSKYTVSSFDKINDLSIDKIFGDYCVYKNTYLEAKDFSKGEIIINLKNYG
ncbi:MAG: hypothetical protein PHP68_05935, partial [Oscillospiraceae bacterium]|nr:hypothetical protein [Oscillospiraceae bacterium]